LTMPNYRFLVGFVHINQEVGSFLVLTDFVSIDTCTGLGFNGDFWINRYIEPEVPDAIITWSQDHLYGFCQ